jgi:hypothetical protein
VWQFSIFDFQSPISNLLYLRFSILEWPDFTFPISVFSFQLSMFQACPFGAGDVPPIVENAVGGMAPG